MATWYVAPNGTGTNTNHWNTPAGAISGDLATTVNNNPALAPGDEIWALGDNNVFGVGGTYNLTAPLLIHGVPLRLYGGFYGTETQLRERNANITCNDPVNFPDYFQCPAILTGAVGGSMINIATGLNYCIVDGFILEAGNTAQGGGIYAVRTGVGSLGIIFENLVFRNNVANQGGGAFLYRCNALFKNVLFHDNTAGAGGGLYLGTCPQVHLVNVLFHGNSANQTGGAIYMQGTNSDNVKIVNNTIANNVAMQGGGNGIYCDSLHLEIYNSIFSPDDVVLIPAANVPIIDFCLLSQNNFPTLSNIVPPPPTNPNFVNPNPPIWDFHLQPTSQCVDWGSAPYIIPYTTTDLEGNARFSGNNVDLGAFEVR